MASVHETTRAGLTAPSAPTPGVRSTTATRSAERALALLAEVCGSDALTLTDCARRTGLPTSTALRLLRTLGRSGFVERGTDGLYRAGPAMIQLGARAVGRHELARLAAPALERIGGRTRESAYLCVAGVGGTAVYVAAVEGTHAVRHTSWVGRAVPMAGLPVGEVLGGRVPEEGYVAGVDRIEPDVTAVVAPVRRPGGIAGALSVIGPSYRIDEATMHDYGRVLAAEADALSRRLGVPPAHEPERQGPHR